MAAMLCDVVVRRRRAHAPVIYAASHFYHEKRVAWVSISMHTCDPVPIVMGLRLAALRAAGAPLLMLEVAYCSRKKEETWPFLYQCNLNILQNKLLHSQPSLLRSIGE